MSECKVLWKSVLSELEVLLTTVSFDMWFKDLEPYTVENDKLVLIAPLNSFKSINKNYKDQIKKAIENSGAKISGIEIITKAETDNYTLSDEEEKEEDDGDTVNMFDPGYTFDSFVVGDSNSIAYAAAEAVKDYRTMQFLDWFVKEQAEEEKNSQELLDKFALYAGDGAGLHALNAELKGRAYAAPSLELD